MLKGSGWVYVVLACCAAFFFGSLWLTKAHVSMPMLFTKPQPAAQELLPLRTCHGLENSTLFKRYKWHRYTKLKGYRFYLEPNMGFLISLQLAPNGRITIFRMNSLTQEPSLASGILIVGFCCDFIYGNEACLYKPLIEELTTLLDDQRDIHYTNVNAIPVMDVLLGLFQSPLGELSGVECRTNQARPWRGASAVETFVSGFKGTTVDDQKLIVPPAYLARKLVSPVSDSKEISDSQNAIEEEFKHAVMTGDAEKAQFFISQMEALGRDGKAERMQVVLDDLLQRYPKLFKKK